MKIELQRRPDGIGVSMRARSAKKRGLLLDSFKRAVVDGARRFDAEAGQWVVRQNHYCWLLLWGAQARREFGASFEDGLRAPASPLRPRTAPTLLTSRAATL